MEEDDIIPETDETVVLDDTPEEDEGDVGVRAILETIRGKWTKASDARINDEKRWLSAYQNYRGIYSDDMSFTEAEKSRVFVKVTKTKVLAAYGQITDVLFANNSFPLSIEPTELPEKVAEAVHFDPQQQQQPPSSPYGFPGDGMDLQPGDTLNTLMDRLGPLSEPLSDINGVKEGAGATPSSATFYPAMVAAKKMEKKIKDQLEESSASKHLRSTAFEMALFGTGIMKGPFAVEKEYANWDDEGEYDPNFKLVPQVSHVSIWDFYPDPDATNMDDANYVFQRHRLNRSQLRELKKRPHFRSEAIDLCIEMGENFTREYWEDTLRDYQQYQDIERFEVLEYWGCFDRYYIEENGIELPEGLQDVDEIHANAWVCNNKLIRLVLNPFKPMRIPYMAVPYEMNPYSFFGVGLAENMEDTQTLMNGFMRMAVDNAVLSGNLLIEIDETNLVPGQDMAIYPGKVFRRQAGAPGQAIFGTKFPNVAGENMQLFDKARQLADESTGFPSFAHGQTGVTGVGRTASGISMLMNAASGSIKTVIKNIDDYLLRPLGEGLFQFNMQFDFDPETNGDLEVKARGTESLMANEVRSQRLMQFLQITSNQMLAPFAKTSYIIREIAKSLELDPEKVTNNMEEAIRQAQLLAQTGGIQQMAEQQAGGPAGANPADPTGAGGGTIGTGVAPAPGEPGFTGNGPQSTQQPQDAGQQQPPMGGIQ
ncbi:MAG: portal protein [Luminiphilus sp.]